LLDRTYYDVIRLALEKAADGDNNSLNYVVEAQIACQINNNYRANANRDFIAHNLRMMYRREQNKMFLPMFFPAERWDINWRTSDTIGIARSMFAMDEYSSYGILRDALMDAGCEEPDIMEMVNSPYLCRGCWLLEQLR
jgi:hypothetical protein